MSSRFWKLGPIWVALACLLGANEPGSVVDYGRDIQPILSENCFRCHGPDKSSRKADLRLDSLEGAITNDAIVPGESEASEVIRRIMSNDPKEMMPPPASNLKLTDSQKNLLRQWIDQGAKYSKHWAFVEPKRPNVPSIAPDVLKTARVVNPIDAFVIDRLVREKLTPAPEADRAKLLRRVTLDLTGLPPTLEEIDAFLKDQSPNAYEKVLDRLLASKHYGERMVWEWLDAARYADTNGYQGDPTRAMWHWRDWAINAFNRNMPYDQFTVEQIAGDLLPNSTTEQKIATGFHRNHMINGEGGRIAEESRVEYVQDRVETTGAVWLGLTLTCCRCHDHKYDPFSQKEYYQLSAYFNSIDESGGADGGLANPVLSIATPNDTAKIENLKKLEQQANQKLADLEKDLKAKQTDWEKNLNPTQSSSSGPVWHVLSPRELSADHGTKLAKQADGSLLATGPSPDKNEYLLVVESQLGDITGFKIEALPDDSLKNRGPGRASENGNFVLSELKIQANGRLVDLGLVSADYSQQGWEAAGSIDGKPETGWGIASEFGKPHQMVLEVKSKFKIGTGSLLSIRLSCLYGQQHTLGRFRISATTDHPATLRPTPEKIRTILAKASKQRSPAEAKDLTQYYLDTNAELALAKRERDESIRTRENAERQLPRTMVMRERTQPRETFILAKGVYNAQGEKVEHGVLTDLLKPPADAPKNRLTLARWLVDPRHPLTARVTVNRLWQQLFGVGLVKSSEDFGVQGDKPSHPELLDWLAVEFQSGGWDVKRFIKLIMMSSTYRQSSKIPPGMAERDPENRLLARGPRHRLPSWLIRDQALATSGLLADKPGGPPTKGYQPPGVWEDATFGQIRYEQDHGDVLYRRSLYLFWRRIVAPTIFFDVATRQTCSVKTGRTNTPLHALITLNDVTYVESARALAQRTLASQQAKTDEDRVTEMFRRCVSRPPQPRELDRLRSRLASARKIYSIDFEAAKKLIAMGESKPDPQGKPEELAAWTNVALLILNLDETLSKE